MEFRKKVAAVALLATLASGAAVSALAAPRWGDSTISNMAGPWPIEVRTCARFAGAICSLTWRGKQFVNVSDHGRELQSATSFDYLGETFNPTEAGSRWDGAQQTSSSRLQGIWTAGNVLATQTQMAFWLRPGETAPDGQAQNTSVLSNHVLNKQVTIGLPGMAHVIEYRTQINIPADESHFVGVFEVVTGYMPPEFSKFYTYDPATRQLQPIDDGPGEQPLPVILSTPDGGWAMGIYSPPHAASQPVGHGRFRFPDVVKWNTVYRVANPRGSYHFISYVVVGSLENVTVSLDQLKASGY